MAQYLLAVYYADREISAEEFQRLCAEVPALDARMTDSGALMFHGGLLPPESSATVVRQSGDEFEMSDGPYTQAREHLGGVWVINAADLDAALEWAKLAAVACRRPVEVVPFEMRDISELLAASAAGQL